MNDENQVTSFKSHLVKAYLDWMFENDSVVYVSFVATHSQVSFTPMPSANVFNEIDIDHGNERVKVKTLTLNIGVQAVDKFQVMKEGLSFYCRFSGLSTYVFIPFESIIQMAMPHKDIYCPLEYIEDSGKTEIVEQPKPEETVVRPKLTVVK